LLVHSQIASASSIWRNPKFSRRFGSGDPSINAAGTVAFYASIAGAAPESSPARAGRPPPDNGEIAELLSREAEDGLFIGTSSWKYPG
jgi:hypothetical protein